MTLNSIFSVLSWRPNHGLWNVREIMEVALSYHESTHTILIPMYTQLQPIKIKTTTYHSYILGASNVWRWLLSVGFGHAYLTKTFDNKKSQLPSSSPKRCDNKALTLWDLVDVPRVHWTRAHWIWTTAHDLCEMMSTMTLMLRVVGCSKKCPHVQYLVHSYLLKTCTNPNTQPLNR